MQHQYKRIKALIAPCNHSLWPRLHGYVFKSFCFHSLRFQINVLWIAYWIVLLSHDRFDHFREKKEVKAHCIFTWKRVHVIGALGPVIISLLFHLLFTWEWWRRSWKRKVDGFENATTWKWNDLNTHLCNRGLSWRQVCYENLIHYLKFHLYHENSISRKPFTSANRYAIQTFKLQFVDPFWHFFTFKS